MWMLLPLLLVSSTLGNPRAHFQSFKTRMNKTYTSLQEEETRFAIFQDNLKRIEKHNAESHSWTMGVTKFADMTKYVIVFVSNHLLI